MNTLRDDFLGLGTHNHATSSGSGFGTAGIGSVEHATMIEQAVPAAPTVTNDSKLFATATLLGWRNSTGTYLFANTTHTHAAL